MWSSKEAARRHYAQNRAKIAAQRSAKSLSRDLTCSRCGKTAARELFTIVPLSLGAGGNRRWTECTACCEAPSCITCGHGRPDVDFYTKPNGHASSECKGCFVHGNRARLERMKLEEPAKWMHRVVRQRATTEGIPFAITPADIFIPERCPILGIVLRAPGGGLFDDSPTLDRRVPALGYVPGNVDVISAKANRLKSDATIEQLDALVRWLRLREQ